MKSLLGPGPCRFSKGFAPQIQAQLTTPWFERIQYRTTTEPGLQRLGSGTLWDSKQISLPFYNCRLRHIFINHSKLKSISLESGGWFPLADTT